MKNMMSHEAHNDEGDSVDGEYARVSNVFECNDMVLTYYVDYAGKIYALPPTKCHMTDQKIKHNRTCTIHII
jgi:hypothetical protein